MSGELEDLEEIGADEDYCDGQKMKFPDFENQVGKQ
jgi:hypothetical protein